MPNEICWFLHVDASNWLLRCFSL